jgi:hypothetical protein
MIHRFWIDTRDILHASIVHITFMQFVRGNVSTVLLSAWDPIDDVIKK